VDDKTLEEFTKWYEHGVEQGWITQGFCATHDGDPYMTEEEEKEWDEGGDPCCPVFKVLI